MFFGADFLSDGQALSVSTLSSPIKSFSISSTQFDKIYLTTDTNNTSPSDFNSDANTIVSSTFDDKTLEAGNIGAFGKRLRSIQLKRREKGKNDWTILAGYTITDTDYLNFSFADYFARGRNTKYEYSVTYILDDGTEVPYFATSVTSNFSGAVISDSTTSYHVLLDPTLTSTTRNRESKIVTTLNSKYPYVFWGSESNYDTGTFSGTIVKYDGCDEWDFDNSYRYREEMVNWLTNGSPKILKMEDGREWLMTVDGNVEADNSEHPDKVKISFDFTQIGDFDNSDDLSANGLTSYDESKYNVFYSVSLNLENVTTSNRRVAVKANDTYQTILAPASGYTLDANNVNVVMNGVSITNTVYNRESHQITIPNVTNNVTITATAVRIKAAQIALDCDTLNMKKDNRKTLHIKYLPENAKVGAVAWSSSNEKVATVVNGAVQAVGPGTATITAELDGQKKKCVVNVVSLIDGLALSKFPEGASIIDEENGNDTYFIVAKHNYEPELNGTGLTLLVRKNCYEKRRWHSSNQNAYNGCELDKWFNSTYINLFDDALKNAIVETQIKYTVGNGDSSVKTVKKKVFALSAAELGFKREDMMGNEEGEKLPTSDQLRAAGSSEKAAQWTRTPNALEQDSYLKKTGAGVVVKNDYNPFGTLDYIVEFPPCSGTDEYIKSDYGDPVFRYSMYARPAFTVRSQNIIQLTYDVEVASITLPSGQKDISMFLGNTFQLTPTYSPIDATYPVTSYSSSNPFVASVNENGLITALSVGETTITIFMDNISVTCSVTAKNR